MAETEDYDKSAIPTSHKISHQDGGTDEISVATLSGQLADAQPSTWPLVSGKPSTFAPEAHKTSHQDGGSDEISVAGLSGLLADLQKPQDHSHQSPGGGAGGKLDHGLALDGLLDDDHTQYPLLAGRSAGQTLVGGTGVNDNLKLQGTSGNGTLTGPAIRGLVGNGGATVALTVLNNGNVGIGTTEPAAKLDVVGSVRFDSVDELNWTGLGQGNQSFSHTFTHLSHSSMEITAVFNHYGYITSYGAARKSLVANGPGIMDVLDIVNVASATGGSWTYTRNSDNSITITKTPGTYDGIGYYFVTVRGYASLSK